MCGIAGLVGARDHEDDRLAALSRVRAMVSALARRGPDGEGIESWDAAILGHRRLAIFDLSDAGRQPMVSPDRSLAVVFNGAIYNFLDLRRELSALGYRFRSHTDTEVLLHGYDAWGIDSLVKRLRGMFAIGLWDQRRRKLFLVRDRLGVKPLVYTVSNGQLAFASTARALRQAGMVSELDPQAVAEFLEFGHVTDDRAIYSNASKVPAATILEWCDGRVTQREYWTPDPVSDAPVSFEDAVEQTEQRFLQAVKLRLQADVPVGALLSAGIDSSLICWAVAKLGGNIKAFTIATPGDPGDESAQAIATARHLNIEHSVIAVQPEDAPGVDELVNAYGEPFACASALGILRVSRAVKPHATVLLTGDGGDDCFLGYPEHRHFYLAQRLSRWIPFSHWKQWRARLPEPSALRRAASLLDYATGGLGAITQIHDGLPFYSRHQLLGDRLAGATVLQRAIPRSRQSARRLLTEFLAYDRKTRFVGEYMTKVDGGTMHYALEARAPFLDQELWNYASSLPFSVRLRGGQLKAVLRELARRRIGEQVAAAPKRGFSIPTQRWLAGRWRPLMEECLDNSQLGREGWIRPQAVREQLDTAAARGWAPNQLWYLFVLEHWLRNESSSPALADSAPGERAGVLN